jgi:hypothetical protein
LYGNEIRANSKPIFRLFFLLGAFVSIILYHLKNRSWLLFLFFILGLLSGYRTFVMIYVFYVMLYFFTFVKMSFRKKLFLLFAGLILFFSINLLKLYRDIDEFGMKHYVEILEKEGLSEDYLYLSPILHTVREGPQVFQQIRDNLIIFGNGTYFFENLSTILPGQQRGYGLIYNNLINAVTDNTKTATILGAFYIDGGLFSVVVFSSIIGLLFGILYQKFKKNKDDILSFIPFAYFTSYIAIWTHGGSPFGPTFFIVTFLLLFVIFILRNKFVF